MEVALFSRLLIDGSFSMERLFDVISSHYSTDIHVTKRVMPFVSRGFFRRAANVAWTHARRTKINHVIGDVHYVALALPRKSVVLTVHDCVSVLRATNPVKREILRLFWFSLPVHHARFVTAISEQTKRDLVAITGCPEDKIRVISNCIDPRFDFSAHDFNSDRPRILQIGQSENKNIPRLAAALEGINCHLHIVGRIHDTTRRALKQHRIEYTNSVGLSFDALLSEYQRCDIVAFVSTYEGFGLPVVEAQAVGRPVITSNIQPMSVVSGGAAMLVDPFDVNDIRRGVETLISDDALRLNLVQRGVENAKLYSPAAVAAAYEDLYHRVVESDPSEALR